MGELIHIRDFILARRRARQREEVLEAVAVLQDALEYARFSYEFAPLHERQVRASQIRQLEEVVAYARRYV